MLATATALMAPLSRCVSLTAALLVLASPVRAQVADSTEASLALPDSVGARSAPEGLTSPMLSPVASPVAGAGRSPALRPAPTASGSQPVVTVPLPTGPGAFYYRSGPGPARFRPRIGRRSSPAATEADLEATRQELGLPPSSRPRGAAPSEGVTRLDLLLLERDLLDAIDRRLARLGDAGGLGGVAPAAPSVTVLPGRAQPSPAAAVPPALAVPPRSARPLDPVTVETVERAVLETGLFRTSSVNFEFAKAGLIPASAATLDVVADVLRRYPGLRVEVGGHTDDRGSDATNDRLSQRRAESVMAYLVASGVTQGRLSAVGYGERRPVASNDTETGRALNRRVEFVVVDASGTVRPAPEAGPADVRGVIREELERLRRDG